MNYKRTQSDSRTAFPKHCEYACAFECGKPNGTGFRLWSIIIVLALVCFGVLVTFNANAAIATIVKQTRIPVQVVSSTCENHTDIEGAVAGAGVGAAVGEIGGRALGIGKGMGGLIGGLGGGILGSLGPKSCEVTTKTVGYRVMTTFSDGSFRESYEEVK